jgi:integrase
MKLPACMQYKHGAYYFVKKGKWEWLGRDYPTALTEYGKRITSPAGGMEALIDSALIVIKSKVAKSTGKQYDTAGKILKRKLRLFSPEQVKAKDVARVKLDLASTPNMANRVLTVLRLVFDYAVEQQLIDSNPALGIKRLYEKKRGRLLSYDEFQRIKTVSPPRLQCIMDLLFLTGQRVTDVLRINGKDLLEEGIAFKQQKTGAKRLVRWNPELRAVVQRAQDLQGNIRQLVEIRPLLRNRRGKAPDYSTTKLQWNKACKAAAVEDAEMRDIRAMSATAMKQQKGKQAAQDLLAHTTGVMTERYLRDKETPQVDGPSFVRK